jgi:hypothetical protein
MASNSKTSAKPTIPNEGRVIISKVIQFFKEEKSKWKSKIPNRKCSEMCHCYYQKIRRTYQRKKHRIKKALPEKSKSVKSKSRANPVTGLGGL